ncbi:MAG: hypothetical protein IID45_15065 [Planctomycetes bacterium]|nr:hypothetical protein [Planctomycetota bacterium]
MNGWIKREILLLLAVAVLVACYLALGRKLAPEVPPVPKASPGGVMGWDEFKRDIEQQAALRKNRQAAIAERNTFVTRWYQWGAGTGIALLILFSFWRPPWFRARVETQDNAVPAKRTPTKRKRSFNVQISTRAWLMMGGSLLLLIVLLVLILIMINGV